MLPVLVLLVPVVLAMLRVVAADEVVEEVADRLEPPQAPINTAAARTPKILRQMPHASQHRGEYT